MENWQKVIDQRREYQRYNERLNCFEDCFERFTDEEVKEENARLRRVKQQARFVISTRGVR